LFLLVSQPNATVCPIGTSPMAAEYSLVFHIFPILYMNGPRPTYVYVWMNEWMRVLRKRVPKFLWRCTISPCTISPLKTRSSFWVPKLLTPKELDWIFWVPQLGPPPPSPKNRIEWVLGAQALLKGLRNVDLNSFFSHIPKN